MLTHLMLLIYRFTELRIALKVGIISFFLCDITFVNVIIYLFLITHSKHDEITVKEKDCQGFVENIKNLK